MYLILIGYVFNIDLLVSEYLITICEFMKPVPVEKYFDVGRRPQTIAWHVFTFNGYCKLDSAVRLTRIEAFN